MTKIILDKVSKIYGKEVLAADEVSFEAKEGDFLVLVGPSGCGKTTILRMLAGLEEISSGKLYFDGKLMNRVPARSRDVGMVFQNYALYPHLTVFDNIAFPLSVRREKKKFIRKRVEEVLEMLDLKEFGSRKPKELSGGQRQRVALGRAVVRKPKVFLFDEPLSNLDAKLRVQMRTEITRLQKKLGITSVYVTHDQTEAMTMGSRLVILKKGKVMQDAPPSEIYENPANTFVGGFIGSPQMNFFEGRISAKNENMLKFEDNQADFILDIPAFNFLYEKPEPGREIIIGIRPENIILLNKDNSGQKGKLSANEIKIEIENIEYIGHENILYFRSGNSLKCVRTAGAKINVSPGKASLFLPPDKIIPFSRDGKRL